MKWHVAFAHLALLIGITCAGSLDEKYDISPEYKNIYETIKAQASTGVYFKPIEGYFGSYYKTTVQPSNSDSHSVLPTQSIKPETSTTSNDYHHTTSTPYTTSGYSSSQRNHQVSYATSKAPETSSKKYPVPFYLKAKETLPIKMDEPLFYSDYHNQATQDATYKTTTNNYHKTSYETTTIKYDENSVPVYYLSKPYHANQESYTTASPPTTTTPLPVYTTHKPFYDKSHSKETNYPSPQLPPSKADDVYFTSEKPADNYRLHNQKETSTPAYSQTTTKSSVKHAYQKQTTTPQSTNHYETSKPVSYEKVNDAKTTQPTKAQKLRPFRFSYAVSDKPSHNDFSHQQESDGNVVTGSYRVLLPDGRLQVVTYRADKYGYKAYVRYESSNSNKNTSSTTPSSADYKS